MLRKCGVSFLLLLILTVFFGCGKVVQEVSKEEIPRFFDLTFNVDVQSKLRDDKTNSVYQSSWDISDTEVFVQIVGITEKGSEELSWGKSVLVPQIVSQSATITALADSLPTSTVFESVPFRKDGMRLVGQADHTWTKIVYAKDYRRWEIDSRKLEFGYPYYQLYFFSDVNHFLMKTLDTEMVSSNAVIALGEVDDYDVFLSILVRRIFEERPDYLNRLDVLDILERLFPVTFYTMLHYQPPSNVVKSFENFSPDFHLDGIFESELVKWFFLFDEDVDVARDYVNDYESKWFTPEIRSHFESVIDVFESYHELKD